MVAFTVKVVAFAVGVVGFVVVRVVFSVGVVVFAVDGLCLQDRIICRLQLDADAKTAAQKVHLLRSTVLDACLRLTCRFKFASTSER